jgi:hypothetical protein
MEFYWVELKAVSKAGDLVLNLAALLEFLMVASMAA